MNDTMERQEQYTRSNTYYGADQANRQFDAGRRDYVQQRPQQSERRTSYPDYDRAGYSNGYSRPGYGYNDGYYGGYANGAAGYDTGNYYAPTDQGEAYRASYDNRYNYEAPSAAPACNAAEYDFDGYSMSKDGKKEKKKMRLNTKAKILIALYFAIIAVVATLILVNVVIGGSEAVAVEEPSAYTEEAAVYFVGADGSETMLNASNGFEYKYDTQTNSFDEFCDWLGEQVG